MTATSTGRSTAAALMLLLALVLALLTALIVPAFISWTESGRSIRADREKIAAVKASQTAFIRVKNANDSWTLFADSPDSGFLDAQDGEDALTQARARVESVLGNYGGTLETADFTAGETKRGQVATVVMDLAVTLPKPGLAGFLSELEEARPYAYISAFRVVESGDDALRLTLSGQMHWLTEAPQ